MRPFVSFTCFFDTIEMVGDSSLTSNRQNSTTAKGWTKTKTSRVRKLVLLEPDSDGHDGHVFLCTQASTCGEAAAQPCLQISWAISRWGSPNVLKPCHDGTNMRRSHSPVHRCRWLRWSGAPWVVKTCLYSTCTCAHRSSESSCLCLWWHSNARPKPKNMSTACRKTCLVKMELFHLLMFHVLLLSIPSFPPQAELHNSIIAC